MLKLLTNSIDFFQSKRSEQKIKCKYFCTMNNFRDIAEKKALLSIHDKTDRQIQTCGFLATMKYTVVTRSLQRIHRKK